MGATTKEGSDEQKRKDRGSWKATIFDSFLPERTPKVDGSITAQRRKGGNPQESIAGDVLSEPEKKKKETSDRRPAPTYMWDVFTQRCTDVVNGPC